MNELKNNNNIELETEEKKSHGIEETLVVILSLLCLATGTCLAFNVDPGSENHKKFPKIFQTPKEQLPKLTKEEETDFGPYMRNLQNKIKSNWAPPKSNESKRVILIFKIAKDGNLVTSSVLKSSGNPEVDNAAKEALLKSAPFEKLPDSYKGNSVEVQFSFDYNVFKQRKAK